jgi:hypothetical protein
MWKVGGKVVPLLNRVSSTPWRRMGERMLTSALVRGEWSAFRQSLYWLHYSGSWRQRGIVKYKDRVQWRTLIVKILYEFRILGYYYCYYYYHHHHHIYTFIYGGVSIIFSTCAATCTAVAVASWKRYMIVLAYLWSRVSNFRQLGRNAGFYVLLFQVVMQFYGGSEKRTTSNFAQISEKVRRETWQWMDTSLGKRPWALYGMSNSPRRKKLERWRGKSSDCFIWHQGGCSRGTHAGRPNTQFRILLRYSTASAWKCAKTSPRTLATNYLANAYRQRTASYFIFP